MAGDLGVGRGLAESRNEELRPSVHSFDCTEGVDRQNEGDLLDKTGLPEHLFLAKQATVTLQLQHRKSNPNSNII
jgi:hypothetical protein